MAEFLTRNEVQSEVKIGITNHELDAAGRLENRKDKEKDDRHEFNDKLQSMFDSIDQKIETKLSTIAFRWFVGLFIGVLGSVIGVIYYSQLDNKEDIISIKISQARMVEKQSQMSEKITLIYEKIVKGN